MKSRYIGLTGLPAAGKGTFLDLLTEDLARRSVSHTSVSLSDELRAEVRFRGLAVTRDVLRDAGHELRLKHGSDVLARRILDKLAFDLRQGLQYAVIVIDAIRNPAEARLLRQSLDEDFRLVAIEAPTDVIVTRLKTRARQGDVLDSDALAHQVLAAEMGVNEPDHGHNIADCIALADVHISNGGPLPQLKADVAHFVEAELVPHL